jgi:2-polyprenyl-3-methyl-5-hydroxy-6-metoxy-1,4-benzoquinol methylase
MKENALVRDAQADSATPEAVPTLLVESGAASRFGLFLCDCSDPEALRKTLSRIPSALAGLLEEVIVMEGRADGPSLSQNEALQTFPHDGPFEMRFHRPPRVSSSTAGFGAIRKAAFEYALRKGFDHVIIMRGDSSEPPETLPELLRLAVEQPARFVLATNASGGRSDRMSSFVLNRILGMRLGNYRTSYRLYPCEALARIPFQLASDGPLFDTEVILQLRALGIPIHEAALAEFKDDVPPNPATTTFFALKTAIGYRLHQLHITRDGRYLVDHDIHYTLKKSGSGSHAQIIAAIDEGSAVLDLGCSNGLLARPLLEKNVRVTGVDAGPGEKLARELADYYQRDLELPLDLPYGRVFDYVVCADVIEHLKNRAQLLRGARRYLKPDGRLVISTPNIALWFYRLSLLVGRFEYGPRGVLDETHLHLYTGATFRREVEKAGFTVLQQRVTTLPFEVVFESTGRSRLIRGIESFYHFIARLWPSMFAYQNILEAEITTLDEESTKGSRPDR